MEVIPSGCAVGLEDEINEAIEKYSEPKEEHRGLMIYYNEDSPVNEKVVSAFPSVEVRNGELVGVLTCKLTEPLMVMCESQLWKAKNCLIPLESISTRFRIWSTV